MSELKQKQKLHQNLFTGKRTLYIVGHHVIQPYLKINMPIQE